VRRFPSDRELVRRSRNGQAKAFAALVERHGGAVAAVAFSTTGDPTLSEDIAQDTFLEAWKRLGDLRQDTRLKSWLCAIARNLARTALRRRREIPVGSAPVDAVDQADSPAAAAEANKQHELVWRALEDVPDTYREVLVLYYREGRSAQDVAQALGLNRDTVMQRLSRGRRLLKGSVSDLVEASLSSPRTRGLGAVVVAALAARGEISAAQAATVSAQSGGVATAIGVFMSSKLKLACVAALALAVAWWALGSNSPGDPVSTDDSADVGPAASAPHRGATRPGTDGNATGRAVGAPARRSGAPQWPSPAVVAELDGARDSANAGRAVFSGRVLDWATNRGVAGAELTFATPGGTQTVHSAGDGMFELAVDQMGTVRMAAAVADGYLPFAPEWERSPVTWTAQAGRRVTNVLVLLTPAVTYVGTVVSPDGSPVPGAEVRLLGAGQGEHALVPLARDRFVTDTGGRFTFHSPDGMLLEATHAEFDPGRARLDGAVQVSKELTIRLAPRGDGPDRSLSVEGIVVDASGAPAGGVALRAQAVSAAGKDALVQSTRVLSADDGRFAISGLPAGELDVAVDEDGYEAVRVRARAGQRHVRVELRDAVSLSGSVKTSAGPVASFLLVVEQVVGPLERHRVAERAFVDPEGQFAVDTLGPGTYVVYARAPGLPRSERVEVTLRRKQPVDDVRLVVGAGGRLSGRVVAADDGAPIPLARVTLEGTPVSSVASYPYAASLVTDSDGRFVVDGVAPGRRGLVVAAHGRHPKIVTGLDVTANAEVSDIVVELRPLAPGERPEVEVAGIGVAIAPEADGLRISQLAPTGGAAEVGLRPGDVIKSVDRVAVVELGFRGAVDAIRGRAGTLVVIGFERDGVAAELPVPRRVISMAN